MQRLTLAILVAFIPWHALSAAPRVVVSIAPVHSLVQAVLGKVGEPVLLLRSNQSPHSGSLPPSAVRAIVSADLVVWVGPSLEGVLVKLLGQLPSDRIVTLIETRDMKLLNNRGVMIRHESAHEHRHDHKHEATDRRTSIDPHIWLSTTNAIAIVEVVARWLSEHDGANASVYRKNKAVVVEKIKRLREELAMELESVKGLNFFTFHDAYQYFEDDFEIRSSASVSVDPENLPGARHLDDLLNYLKTEDVRCIFTEPQFDSDAVDVLSENSHVGVGTLDPLGVELIPSKEMWFELMRNLVNNFTACLRNTA
ncbi:MAG: zinc ABC transporter substrate-binding protein [Gammaproteobacteria bacterium]|jgi:zinc transport system substrate-binding protein